ncbi:MAG: hypothetical protein KAG53_05540 [Endozoicomonadaceae bacterium]|nr:hypothetical protein [Endozoicomonadaceae bacterium]
MDSNNKINQKPIIITESNNTQDTKNKSGYMDAANKTVDQHGVKKNIDNTECSQNNSMKSIHTRSTSKDIDSSDYSELLDDDNESLTTLSFENAILAFNDIPLAPDDFDSLTENTKKQLKQHSFLWIVSNKIMRFFRSLSLHNDSKNLTLKDFKKMPKELIIISDDKIKVLLENYNKEHSNMEFFIHKYDKHHDDLIDTKKRLLQLSKDIFKHAEHSSNKKKSLLNSTLNNKEKYQFIEIMKSKIGFNPERVNEHSLTNHQHSPSIKYIDQPDLSEDNIFVADIPSTKTDSKK